MNKIKVIVQRQVTETWEFFIDADKLDIPISSEGLTSSEAGDARNALHDAINGIDDGSVLSDEITDSNVYEESIIEWGRA